MTAMTVAKVQMQMMTRSGSLIHDCIDKCDRLYLHYALHRLSCLIVPYRTR
jgi:hypothetical protein